MLNSDSSSEKPLYSCVVATPTVNNKENQTKCQTSEATQNIENDHCPINHLESDKFKIDRRKLEKMIATSSNTLGLNNAEYFFKNIMQTTDTFITWQRNLKVGARTRKHPFVNIVGKPNDIAWARGLILARLAPRGPLLNIKMVISDTDHPHLLGDCFGSFKTIMEETDTLIHFPDSNNHNLVSIYGTIDSLEQARLALRSSTPLLMSFELPIGMQLSKHNIEYIKQLESNLNVKIVFMAIPKTSSLFAIVKGTEGNVDNLKEAVGLLVKTTCGTSVDSVMLNIKIEISKKLFELSMFAENNLSLMDLQEKTQTIISVPSDLNEDDDGQKKKIIITGTIDGVYEVRKQIMSQLPIELTFDIKENPYYTAEILCLGMKYGISLTMQHNQKDKSERITMRAPENIISHIYAAKEEVMEMQNSSDDEAELPKAYFKALESDSCNSDLGHLFEDISKKIWTPIETNGEHYPSSNWTEVSNDSQNFDFDF